MRPPPRPTFNKRTAAQRSADLIVIERETLRGSRQWQIAELLATMRPYKLSRQMIAYDLKDLERRWIASATNDIATARCKMIEGLQEQRRELWAAWEKSKADATTKTAEQITGAGKSKTKGGSKQRATVETQCGDPAYQRLILEIDERIAKLRGLDAPVKQDFTTDGQPLQLSAPTQVVIYLPQKGTLDGNGNGSHALIVEREPAALPAKAG